jgi:hypothetical protein
VWVWFVRGGVTRSVVMTPEGARGR